METPHITQTIPTILPDFFQSFPIETKTERIGNISLPTHNAAMKTQQYNISNRIDFLKNISFDDGEAPASAASEKALMRFFSQFLLKTIPSITLTADGYYFVELESSDITLYICFCEDNNIEFVIKIEDNFFEGKTAYNTFNRLFKAFINETFT